MGPSSKSRMQILDMIADGKISAEEGVRLLEALAEGEKPSIKAAPSLKLFSSESLVIRVINRTTDEVTVNLRVPVSLISTARKQGAKIVSDIDGLDLETILKDLLSGEAGGLVRIERENEIIEVVIE